MEQAHWMELYQPGVPGDMSDREQDRIQQYPEGAHHFRRAAGLAMLFAIILRMCLPLVAFFALAIWITGPWEILALVPLLLALVVEERWSEAYSMWMAFIGGTIARALTRGGRHG